MGETQMLTLATTFTLVALLGVVLLFLGTLVEEKWGSLLTASGVSLVLIGSTVGLGGGVLAGVA